MHANINPTECFLNFTWSLNNLNFFSTSAFVSHFWSTTMDHDCIGPVIRTATQYELYTQNFVAFLNFSLLCIRCVYTFRTTPPHKEAILSPLL